MQIDFELSGHGTLYLFRPIVVEPRDIGPIIGGAIGDGLVVP